MLPQLSETPCLPMQLAVVARADLSQNLSGETPRRRTL